MIVDGRKIAEELTAALKKDFESLGKKAKLGVLLMSADFATQKFIAIKRRTAEGLGVELVERIIPQTATTEEVVSLVKAFSSECDGLIVQLPLAPHIDVEKVIASIPPDKDVDGIAPGSKVLSPVVEAMREVLVRVGVPIAGKQVIVVGQGKLVGLPATEWLKKEGALTKVLTEKDGDLQKELSEADMIVLGAGQPGLVQPYMLKPGVVLFDMGTSEAGGKLVGDADPACAEVASVFTPVPGGMGPIAVVMIFKNLLRLIQQR